MVCLTRTGLPSTLISPVVRHPWSAPGTFCVTSIQLWRRTVSMPPPPLTALTSDSAHGMQVSDTSISRQKLAKRITTVVMKGNFLGATPLNTWASARDGHSPPRQSLHTGSRHPHFLGACCNLSVASAITEGAITEGSHCHV